MNEDDFLLDEEDEDLDENYVTPEDEDEDSDSDNEDGNSGSDEEEDSRPEPTEQDYNGRMTRDEIYLSSAYDDIVTSAKKNEAKVSTGGGRMFDGNIVDDEYINTPKPIGNYLLIRSNSKDNYEKWETIKSFSLNAV